LRTRARHIGEGDAHGAAAGEQLEDPGEAAVATLGEEAVDAPAVLALQLGPAPGLQQVAASLVEGEAVPGGTVGVGR
jgi:hypothetical protein